MQSTSTWHISGTLPSQCDTSTQTGPAPELDDPPPSQLAEAAATRMHASTEPAAALCDPLTSDDTLLVFDMQLEGNFCNVRSSTHVHQGLCTTLDQSTTLESEIAWDPRDRTYHVTDADDAESTEEEGNLGKLTESSRSASRPR